MKQRTEAQNASLHLWLRQVADTLNDAGLDMKTVLSAKEVDVPWTAVSAKEVLWRPLQETMTLYESTTQASTTDYPAVYEVLCRHFGQHMGVTLPPWPDRFSQSQESQG